jgi:TorA maturation chaperone TorD
MEISTLRAAQILSEFSSRLLYYSPTQGQLAQLAAQRVLLLEEPFSTVAPQAVKRLYDLLATAQSEQDQAALLKTLCQDYSYLFYMVGLSHTSPYESVYRTDDRTLFGPTTLEVRACYRAYNLALTNKQAEPEDHIGLEFLFVALLLDRAAQASDAGDERGAEAALNDLRRFLGEHLLVFAFVYLANLKTRAQTAFYQTIAEIAAATLTSLADEFGVQAQEQINAADFLLAE